MYCGPIDSCMFINSEYSYIIRIYVKYFDAIILTKTFLTFTVSEREIIIFLLNIHIQTLNMDFLSIANSLIHRNHIKVSIAEY